MFSQLMTYSGFFQGPKPVTTVQSTAVRGNPSTVTSTGTRKPLSGISSKDVGSLESEYETLFQNPNPTIPRQKRILQPSPLKQGRPSPLKQTLLSPFKQTGYSSLKQTRASPLKQGQPSPLKQILLSPLKQSRPSPLKQTLLSPLKQTLLSPLKQQTGHPPVKQTRVSPRKQISVIQGQSQFESEFLECTPEREKIKVRKPILTAAKSVKRRLSHDETTFKAQPA